MFKTITPLPPSHTDALGGDRRTLALAQKRIIEKMFEIVLRLLIRSAVCRASARVQPHIKMKNKITIFPSIHGSINASFSGATTSGYITRPSHFFLNVLASDGMNS